MRLVFVAVAALVVAWPSPRLAHADPGPPAFDVADPAIGRLDPALLSAIQNAAIAARPTA